MSVTTSRMHIKKLNHKILQVKVNIMRSSDILSQRPQHLCTGVYIIYYLILLCVRVFNL